MMKEACGQLTCGMTISQRVEINDYRMIILERIDSDGRCLKIDLLDDNIRENSEC